MDWIKENKKTVAIVAAVSTVLGLGAYFLTKDEEETSVPTQQQQEQQGQVANQQQEQVKHSQAPKDSSNYQTKLAAVISKIVVDKDQQNPNCIDFKTIAKILESSVELSEGDYVALTISQRQERRALEGEQYEQVVMRQCDELENMLNKVQEEIISGLNISQQQFEESLMLIIQRGLHQQLIYLDMAVKQQLKMKLESKKGLDLEKAKEIIRYQNDVIKKEPEYFTRILTNLIQNPEMQQKLPQIINIMLCDKVYEQYKIEEEDIVNMLGPYAQTDAEIHQLMQKAEEGMRDLLQSIVPMGGMGGMGGMGPM